MTQDNSEPDTGTATANRTEDVSGLGDSDCSLIPVTINVFDAFGKHHELGPVWVKLDEEYLSEKGDADGWEGLALDEAEALNVLKSDMECSADLEEWIKANKPLA